MRTNIELNEELLKEARRYSKARTKRALVEEALETYITTKAEARKRATYADRVRSMRSQLADLKLRERPVHILREDRAR